MNKISKKKTIFPKTAIYMLFYVLEKALGIQFETIHDVALELAISFLSTGNIASEFYDSIQFNQEIIEEYGEARSKIIQRIKDQLAKKGRGFPMDKKINYEQLYGQMEDVVDNSMDTIQSIFKYATTQNLVDGYHSLHIDMVWFHDLTQLEQFEYFEKGSPYLLLFLDCATGTIVHYELYEEGGSNITSEQLIEAMDNVIKNGSGPTILHSDSDMKNGSKKIIEEMDKRNITVSLNGNVYGQRDPKHGNQVIERLNGEIKKIIEQRFEKASKPSNFTELIPFIKSVIDHYHNLPHSFLSSIRYNRKTETPGISPSNSYRQHALFASLYDKNIVSQNFDVFPADIEQIKNLNFKVDSDRTKFVNYVLTKININNDYEQLYDGLSQTSFNLDNLQYSTIQENFEKFYSYALANSKDSKLHLFFKDKISGLVKGPGSSNVYSSALKKYMSVKESFQFYFSCSQTLLIAIFQGIFVLVLQKMEQNKQEIIQEVGDQGEAMLNSNKEQTEVLLADNNELKQQVEELKSKLEQVYANDIRKQEHGNKRKNGVIQKLGDPINVNEFHKCLELTAYHVGKNDYYSFIASRNRLTLFILYFSGLGISSIVHVTYAQLKLIFEEKSGQPQLQITKSKKPKHHSFFISRVVGEFYVFRNYNIMSDYEGVIKRFDEWASQNNVSQEELQKLSFFTDYYSMEQACAGSYVTDCINKILKKANRLVNGSKSSSKILSSHSFGINVITSILQKTKSLRIAQLFVNHTSVSSTALYGRDELKTKQKNEISEFLMKSSMDDHDEYQQALEQASKMIETSNDEIVEKKDISLKNKIKGKKYLEKKS